MSRKPFPWISLLWILALAACQAAPTIQAPAPSALPAKGTPAATLPPLSAATSTATPVAQQPPEMQLSPAALKNVSVVFRHPLTGKAAEVLKSQVETFNRSNEWKIRVELATAGSDAALENAVHEAAAEDYPAVVLAPSELIAAWEQSDQRVADLAPYLDDTAWGLSAAERADFIEMYWQQDQAGEKQLALPALRTALGMMYNRSFAADLGFTSPPATPRQFFEQACAAAVANNRSMASYGTGGWVLDTGSLTALSWLTAFGAPLVESAPAAAEGPRWRFDGNEARAALEFLHEQQANGCVWVSKYPTPHTYFSDRLAFLYTATLQDLVPQQGALAAAGNQDKWALLPFPAQNGKPFAYAAGYSLALLRPDPGTDSPADPDRLLAGWLFMRWLSGAEQSLALAEAWPSLPVRTAVQRALEKRANAFPWDSILPLAEAARPAPTAASWRVVRRPLEDAFWQTFNLADEGQLATVLPALDGMVQDLLESP